MKEQDYRTLPRLVAAYRFDDRKARRLRRYGPFVGSATALPRARRCKPQATADETASRLVASTIIRPRTLVGVAVPANRSECGGRIWRPGDGVEPSTQRDGLRKIPITPVAVTEAPGSGATEVAKPEVGTSQ